MKNFIFKSNINKNVCKNVIKYFYKNKDFHVPGITSQGINNKIKKSTDLIINPECQDIEITNYLNELMKVIIEFKKKYKNIDRTNYKWGIVENFNIQRYLPNEGFFSWHSERDGDPKTVKRLLVFMTYLNTLKKNGETEFFYQKLKIKPKEGLTLIWPSDWTHLHRGVASEIEKKYIITGWISFNDK
jgi:hypothetical protein